jgi:hypothetical protein
MPGGISEGKRNWFWTDPYAHFSTPKGEPSPFDRITPDNKIDWWNNKNPKDYRFQPGREWNPTPVTKRAPYESPTNWSTAKYPKPNNVGYPEMTPDEFQQFQEGMRTYPKDKGGLIDDLEKNIHKIIDGKKDVSGKFRQKTYDKGISPYSTGAPKNRMEFYNTERQFGREMQAAREYQFADDFSKMMKKAPKKPMNWMKGGKNLIKRWGPGVAKGIGKGLLVYGAELTGGAAGREIGRTPLMTDPKMTYDQFYEDVFTKQAMWDRQNRPPIAPWDRPSPGLNAL